jgi:hypothetical protein
MEQTPTTTPDNQNFSTALIEYSNFAISKFDIAKEQIAKLSAACSKIVIFNDENLELAEKLAKKAKEIETGIESKRKELTKPILDEKSRVDDAAKSLTNSLTTAIKEVKDKILAYKKKKEAEKQAEIQRLEEERQKKLEEIRQSMADGNQIENVEEKTKEIAELKQQALEVSNQNSISSGPTIRKTWTFEIISEDVVPVKYKSIDERKIKEAIATGIREIPGIKIYQKESITLK